MKKLLLTGMLFLGVGVNAQLPDGSVAPDFTYTDINGNSHRLYDYLNAGKTVIIDVSATWCGPCWNYHNTNAIEDLWVAHGPSGGQGVSQSTTDDVIVLFIEGDGSTSGTDLRNSTSNSYGDWTAGANHPIIDLSVNDASSFKTNYAISAFPTIMKICPNRLLTGLDALPAADLYTEVGKCPPPATSSADVLFQSYAGIPVDCPGTSYTPSIKFMNNSTTTLTSATLDVKLNGVTVSTGAFTGSLSQYGISTITGSAISNFTGGNLVFTVTTAGDVNSANNVYTKNIGHSSTIISGNIKIVPITDKYGKETTWALKGYNGSTKSSGGPYTTAASVGETPQQPKYTILSNGCYYLEVKDLYGDGFTGSSGNGSLSIYVGNTAVVKIDNFTTDYTAVGFVVDNSLSLGENAQLGELNVYPNPATNKVNVSFTAQSSDYTVQVADITGRILKTSKYDNLNGFQDLEIDLKEINSGNYIVTIITNNGSFNRNIIIE